MSNKLIYESINHLYKVELQGQDNINIEESTIYISNQVSLIDFRLILNCLPENTYILASEEFLKTYPILNTFQDKLLIVEMGSIKSIKKTLTTLKEGSSILIYPEGDITKTGTLMTLQDGVSFFARKSNKQIQPIVIEGTERSPFSFYGKSGYTSLKHFPKVRVTIGERFSLPTQELSNRVEQANQDRDYIYGKLNDVLLSSGSRTNRNLWNDLIDSMEVYGSNKKVILNFNGDFSYKELMTKVEGYSRVFRKIETNHTVGVLLPESVEYLSTIFSLFRQNKKIVLFPTKDKELFEDYIKMTSVKTFVTIKKFIKFLGLEQWMTEQENKLNVIYLDEIDIRPTLIDKFKTNKKIPEDIQQELIFLDSEDGKAKAIVFSHEQLYAGSRQTSLTVGRQNHDKIFSLISFSESLGFTFGMLFPLLNGLPFVAAYFSPSHRISQSIYSFNISMILAHKAQLEEMLQDSDPQDLNYTHFVFCPTNTINDEFQREWTKKFKTRIYEGYYHKHLSNFLSLNSNIQYKVNSLGRVMAMNVVNREASYQITSPTLCKTILSKDDVISNLNFVEISKDEFSFNNNYIE